MTYIQCLCGNPYDRSMYIRAPSSLTSNNRFPQCLSILLHSYALAMVLENRCFGGDTPMIDQNCNAEGGDLPRNVSLMIKSLLFRKDWLPDDTADFYFSHYARYVREW